MALKYRYIIFRPASNTQARSSIGLNSEQPVLRSVHVMERAARVSILLTTGHNFRKNVTTLRNTVAK